MEPIHNELLVNTCPYAPFFFFVLFFCFFVFFLFCFFVFLHYNISPS